MARIKMTIYVKQEQELLKFCWKLKFRGVVIVQFSHDG